MSWSVNAQKVPADQVVETIIAFELGTGYGADFAYPEANVQLQQAKTAAVQLFMSGAVGLEGEFNIHLGGHAEPNHVKRPGYAQSSVSVWITQYYDYANG